LEANRRLGIEFDAPHSVSLSDGSTVNALARIRDFGGENGMLIIDSNDDRRLNLNKLVAEGYGYVVMDGPQIDADFDLECDQEMLADWGWSGDPQRIPSWLRPLLAMKGSSES